MQQLTCKTAQCQAGITGTVDWINLSSYISTQRDPQTTDLSGGFLLEGGLSAVPNEGLKVAGLAECDIVFGYDYQFSLTSGPIGGVLSVSTRQLVGDYDNNILCAGGNFYPLGEPVPIAIPDTVDPLATALNQTIPNTIFDSALASQSQDLSGLLPILNGDATCLPGSRASCAQDTDCPPLGTFEQYCDFSDPANIEYWEGIPDHQPVIPGVCATKDPCGDGEYYYSNGDKFDSPPESARSAAGATVITAARALGLSQSAQQRLVNAVNAQDSEGHYTNFRCVSSPDASTGCNRNSCNFVLRPTRLNVRPDNLELVFFDSLSEYDNPAVAAYLVVAYTKGNVGVSVMCNNHYPDQQTIAREYTTSAAPPLTTCNNVPASFGCNPSPPGGGPVCGGCAPFTVGTSGNVYPGSAECTDGFICEDGTCQYPTGYCGGDADCGPGYCCILMGATPWRREERGRFRDVA